MQSLLRSISIVALVVVVSNDAVKAQSPSAQSTTLIADMRFDGSKANAIGPGDSAIAQAATARLRSELHSSTAFSLVDSARASAELAAGDLPGVPCAASIDCVRRAGQRLGARWAVTGTVTKLSNLIWYLSGQVIDVATGRIVLDDGFELKGPRDEMVPRGAASLARRVARATVGDTTEIR